MDSSEVMHNLSKQLEKFDWFTGNMVINPILHKSIVVFVHFLNENVYKEVPDNVGGWEIRPWLVGYANAHHDYVPDRFALNPLVGPVVTQLPDLGDFEGSLDPSHEMAKLKKICGVLNLEDMLYEILDQDDAITDRSSKFPEVRQKLDELYLEYGFDVLYEEL